uniref:Uncharacterized protein n=1 Tax=Rhizophora mucronata TaxID=61149 RepID=A0A2P2J539_RHIMU
MKFYRKLGDRIDVSCLHSSGNAFTASGTKAITRNERRLKVICTINLSGIGCHHPYGTVDESWCCCYVSLMLHFWFLVSSFY